VALKSAKDLALLAGRKLLLADDSITIQKVVDLTFADEGVKVICFGNGKDAVEHLEEIAPDIVLADVFMPQLNGYEVCEYVKQNEKLKHIPVMLLVGSFEPFDEAEARRVGADDILTKPFQSIRRLIDRVGGLVSGRPEGEMETAELPKPQVPLPEPERLSSEELALSTADTQRLTDDVKALAASIQQQQHAEATTHEPADEKQMETSLTAASTNAASETDDVLLDLGDLDLAPVDDAIGEEFVLDLEVNEPLPAQTVAVGSASAVAFAEPEVSRTQFADWGEVAPSQEASGTPAFASATTVEPAAVSEQASYSTSDPLAATQEIVRPGPEAEGHEPAMHRVPDEVQETTRQTGRLSSPASSGQQITLEQVSPEVIDAIARRAVELLSEKAVREIAWEVVPTLAELMIKRQLEEKKS
jgi:CheY-like chemotaxis protein